jgi:hypothetical protein
MTAVRVMLIGAVLWALAFILSAWVFRGRAVGEWIEGALLVGWIVFFSLWTEKSGRAKT